MKGMMLLVENIKGETGKIKVKEAKIFQKMEWILQRVAKRGKPWDGTVSE